MFRTRSLNLGFFIFLPFLVLYIPFHSYVPVWKNTHFEIQKNYPLPEPTTESSPWFSEENPGSEEEVSEWKMVGCKFSIGSAIVFRSFRILLKSIQPAYDYLPELKSSRSPPHFT